MAIDALVAKATSTLDANALPAAGGISIAGVLPYAVSFLYDKVPAMVDIVPETTFLSLTIGLSAWVLGKMNLKWSAPEYFVK